MDLVTALNAQYNFDLGLYTIDCSTKFKWTFKARGAEFNVDGKNLMWPFGRRLRRRFLVEIFRRRSVYLNVQWMGYPGRRQNDPGIVSCAPILFVVRLWSKKTGNRPTLMTF